MNLATSHTRLDTEAPQHGALLVGCAVSETFVPALEAVAVELAKHHPKASTPQLLDMIFLRGIIGFTAELNLPRPGSNPDEDS